MQYLVKYLRITVTCSLLACCPGLAGAQTLTVATWNIENFWHVPAQSLRGPHQGREVKREAGDYAALRALIADVDADVWALQEIGSPEAARTLFPVDQWRLIFSPRYAATAQRDIYTALVIHRDLGPPLETDVIPLEVQPGNRLGLAARLEVDGQSLWVTSVHLKAGCQYDRPHHHHDRPACATLARQLEVLEGWVDAHADRGLILMGDFNRTFMGDRRRRPSGLGPVWQDLNDGEPLPLFAFPFTPEVDCPEAKHGARTWPIDFIITDAHWALRARPGPYVRPMGAKNMSDHCPVVVEFDSASAIDRRL